MCSVIFFYKKNLQTSHRSFVSTNFIRQALEAAFGSWWFLPKTAFSVQLKSPPRNRNSSLQQFLQTLFNTSKIANLSVPEVGAYMYLHTIFTFLFSTTDLQSFLQQHRKSLENKIPPLHCYYCSYDFKKTPPSIPSSIQLHCQQYCEFPEERLHSVFLHWSNWKEKLFLHHLVHHLSWRNPAFCHRYLK